MKFGTVFSIKWWHLIVLIAVMIILYFTLSIYIFRNVEFYFPLEACRSIYGTSFVCIHERVKLTFTLLLLTIGHAKTTRTRSSINVFFSIYLCWHNIPCITMCSGTHLGSESNFLWLLCTNCIETEDCYLLGRDDLHIYQTTRNCFSEDNNLHRHHLENLKFDCIEIIERV